MMEKLICSVGHGVPAALTEVIALGRTLTKRADDGGCAVGHVATA